MNIDASMICAVRPTLWNQPLDSGFREIQFLIQVVDMFGCGLPVAAKSCPALHELVINGINGMIFDTPEELAKQVQ